MELRFKRTKKKPVPEQHVGEWSLHADSSNLETLSGCFHKWGVPFVGALVVRALLFGV